MIRPIKIGMASVAVVAFTSCGGSASTGTPPTVLPGIVYVPSAVAATAPATPTPAIVVTPTPTPTAVPSSVLAIPEFGFQVTLSPGVADATYSVDSSTAGTYANVDGSLYTLVADVDLTTPAISDSPTVCNWADGPYIPAQIEVFATDPNSVGVPNAHVGAYWLGFVPSSDVPTGCSAGTAAMPLLEQAALTATQLP